MLRRPPSSTRFPYTTLFRDELEPALFAGLQLLLQCLAVCQVDQRGLQWPLVQMRRLKWSIRGHERLQGAVRLLDAPAQLAPQPHEQVDSQEGNRVGFRAVSVLQRGQIEIAARIGIRQHQYLAKGDIRKMRLQLVEGRF